MKLIQKSQAQAFQNSPVCTAFEYSLGDKDINGAVIVLNGRYPEGGYAVNDVSKELAFVLKGSGKLVVESEEMGLSEGDQALILPGEKYYFEGDLEMFMVCTPAWYPGQHREVDA